MREQTVIRLIHHLKSIIDRGISKNAYANNSGLPTSYFWQKKKQLEIEGVPSNPSLCEEALDLYNTIEYRGRAGSSKKEVRAPEDSTERTEIKIERNDDNKITGYSFKVYIRDKQPLIGNLSRDEMQLIHRMYSNYGSSITQKEISRFFPEYSLEDFKRILRAFSITKASSPFAPHIIEENSKEELLEMQFREKENDFLRSYEAEKVKQTEAQLRKYMKENQDLKDQLRNFSVLVEGIDVSGLSKFIPATNVKEDRDLIIWLSDMHVGASVSGYSIYANEYDKDEIENRFQTLAQQITREALTFGSFSNVIVCNLGDSLDGYDGQTTRGGHQLAQNMNNKDQLKCFIEVMTKFMTTLAEEVPCGSLSYYCVGESNHDGDFGYSANIALQYILQSMNIEATIFDKFIGEFVLGGTTYILCHGKDNKDMFKNLPLTLDVKTENFINEYLDNRGIKGNVVFAKGDLHQSATTYGRRFTYKSVGSLFGSSEWIHKNFGNTPAACDYSIVDVSGNMLDGRIVLQ